MEREGRAWGNQAEMLLNISQEIVFQHQRDSCQQQHIDGRAFEDAVNSGAFQVDLPRKLRDSHPALVEDGFDQVTDMEVGLRGHGASGL